MQSLQSLIQALTNRVAALETAPVVTPTATATPMPSPTPVTDNACVQPIEPGLTRGTWTTDCLSENTYSSSYDNTYYYAKFYTFTLSASSEVTITLSATDPTLIYLLSGEGTDGDIERIAGYDDTTIATLTDTLQPGRYTIEATTYRPNVTGDFTLYLAIQ